MLWLLLAWSSKNQNKGGLKAASDRRRAGDLLKALYTNGIQKNVQLDIELVDEWESTWPRPVNRTDVERVQLLIRRGGVLDLGSWNAACHQHMALGGVLGPWKQIIWFAHMHPHLDDNKCMHLSDIPGVKCQRGMDLSPSLWRQVLFGVAKQVEAHGSCTL